MTTRRQIIANTNSINNEHNSLVYTYFYTYVDPTDEDEALFSGCLSICAKCAYMLAWHAYAHLCPRRSIHRMTGQ